MRPPRTALALIAALLLGVVACSGGGSPAGPSAKAVVVALPADPTSMDPCDTQTQANGIVLHGNVVQALTNLDPETRQVTPLLAQSWTQQDPTTWTFTLRSGVKFQDGTDFDAEAAAFGINRTQNKSLTCLNAEQFASPTTATATGPLTLKLVTAQPDPILPLRLTYIDLSSPKGTPADAKTTQPVGTGPYSFVSRQIGQQITLTRFDGYWGPKPEVPGARYIIRKEDSVRAGTAKTGEAGIALGIPAQDTTSDNRTRRYTDNSVFFLRLMTLKPPLTDIRVRQAVAYAINKDQLVTQLMPKSGTVTSQIVTKAVNGYVPGYTGPGYDPNKARDLLAQARAAGVPVDTPITLITRPLFPGSDEAIQAIVSQLNSVGFKVTMQSMDNAAWLKYLHSPFPANQPVTIVAVTHDNVSGDAAFTFPKYIAGNGCCSAVDDKQADALIVQGVGAQGQQRAALFQQAATLEYQNDAGLVPIAEQFSNLLLAKGVEYEPNGLTSVQLLLSQVHVTS